jgi:hypothetical protein
MTGSKNMIDEKKKTSKWFDLLHLVIRCPNRVNGQRIVGTTRLVLWCLAFHASGDTDSTFTGLGTLLDEVGGTHNPLSAAIKRLKLAKLISETEEHFDAKNRKGRAATRTLNRELLIRAVAGAEPEREAARAVRRQKGMEQQCRKMLKALGVKSTITHGAILRKEAQAVAEYLRDHAPFDLAFELEEVLPDREGNARFVLSVMRVVEQEVG